LCGGRAVRGAPLDSIGMWPQSSALAPRVVCPSELDVVTHSISPVTSVKCVMESAAIKAAVARSRIVPNISRDRRGQATAS
jgi:hypothetical protein